MKAPSSIQSFCLVAALLAFVLPKTLTAVGSVAETKHNLSASGPGSIRAVSETRICVFCHGIHNSSVQAPLWNRDDPGGYFQMYWSPSLDAYRSPEAAPQPSGSSKLCLSCHDGTIALGATRSRGFIQMQGGITSLPPASPVSGRDLSGGHPISFQITDSLVSENNLRGDVGLRSVSEIRSSSLSLLDSMNRVQCTSCHDPHKDPYGFFLRTSTVSELCATCHQ